jgi:hypothetical protein
MHAEGFSVLQHVGNMAVDKVHQLIDHAWLAVIHTHGSQQVLQPSDQLRMLLGWPGCSRCCVRGTASCLGSYC